MKIKATLSPPKIRIKTPVPFPATVAGTGGIKVSKSGGVWTIQPDFSQLATVLASAIGDPTTKEVWIWDPVTDGYNVLTLAGLGDALFKLTSTTPLAIGTGSKVFTTQSGKDVAVGSWVLATSDANPTVNYMAGQVTAYTGTSLTLGINFVGGAGTCADWTIRVSGPAGISGASNLTNHGVALGTGSPVLGATAAMTDGQLLVGQTGADPLPKTVSGDATMSAAGALTIANSAVTNAKAAQMAANTIKGNNTGGPATPADLTATQATAMLNPMVGDSGAGGTKGLVPAPAAGDAAAGKVLRANGTWGVGSFDVTPEQYGAVGNGVTNDSAAFVSALAALAAAGGGALRLSKRYLLGSSVTIPSRISITGDSRATIVAPGSGAISGLFKIDSQGTRHTTTISINAALFDRQLVLTSATNFTAGRLVRIEKTVGGGVFYGHIAEILSVAGSTVQITPPMPFGLLTSDTYLLQAFTPTDDVTIDNVAFEGSNNASATRGILAQFARRLRVTDCHFQNFLGAAGVYLDQSLGTEIIELSSFNSGTANEAAITVREQTSLHARGINDWLSSGFGQLWFMVTYSHMAQLSSNRAGTAVTGRGVKFDGMLYSTVNQIEGNDSSATGIAITLGTNFNTFSNLLALRNRGGTGTNDVGLWFDGTSSDNLFNGVVAKNNQTADIFIPSGSDRNVIINADYDTIADGGSGGIGGIDNFVQAKQNAGIVLVGWANVNFNSANTDFAITIKSPSKWWRIDSIFLINTGTTASLTTARGGIFTATGGGGDTIVADQALSSIASNTVNSAGNALVLNVALTARYINHATLFYRTSTAQGAAATGRVFVFGRPVPN